jgi:hypothetical protein
MLPAKQNALRFLGTAVFFAALAAFSVCADAQSYAGREDEIVASLAGGRVIVHVTRENIVFAAIDQPVELGSVPPRVVDLDATHVGVLLGASEWRLPADAKPVRLDRDFQRVGAKDPRYAADPAGAESDLETIGTAFLERLRPLVSQLHHKIDIAADEPLFEMVIIGYARDYGPEVWEVEYRVQQEQVAVRGEYLQTRILRPRFNQLYPPEKHDPRMLVEARYPENSTEPPLMGLIQSNDPRIARLSSSEPRFAKVVELINRGQAQKAPPVDSADFMRAVLPIIAGNSRFILATMEEQHGFEWIVPPEEPVEKAKEDKNRPPEAPTLRGKPNKP